MPKILFGAIANKSNRWKPMPFLANDFNLLRKRITARYLSLESEVGDCWIGFALLPVTHEERELSGKRA
ncbi:hypothetical protein WA1_22370 [Scytonema hofmannii PCC 7110]|uniref:Uncharacterized protein n=2 Tax=Scytonema hofmannii TaxID=34078 RepID=A0A139X9R1_9CYAN|nr:hypothetical protein WA1_22370 [Scytonema hofmannii PCC 7110]